MKNLSPTVHMLMCVFALLGASAACGQGYPAKSVRLIVPYAPGGIVDYVGRLIGQRLAQVFGQNIVIDNRPGASGIIGIEITSTASADGYTLLIMDPAIVINPSLLAKVPYDLKRDLLPVTILSSSPLVLVINAKVPANNVQELVNLARSQPGKLSFASAGIGTTPHMAGEMFKALSSITAALPFIKDGRLRGLATTGEQRARALSNLPTIAESGFPGFAVDLWLALFAPSRTAGDVVSRLNSESRKALQHPEVKSGFEKVGADPVGNTPHEAAVFVNNEFKKWAAVLKTANIKAD